MKNKGIMLIIGAIVGFFAGYLLFGKVLGNYVSLSALFDFSGGDLGKFGRSVVGIKNIQQKVMLLTIIGAIGGYIIALVKKK